MYNLVFIFKENYTMKVILAIVQIILILIFLLLGGQKAFLPIPDLIDQGMLWIEDFQVWQVRTIGSLEVLGAIGLFLPYLVKSIPKALVPLASGGLALTMVGAIITHISRADPILSIILTSIFFLMAAMITLIRFKQYKSES